MPGGRPAGKTKSCYKCRKAKIKCKHNKQDTGKRSTDEILISDSSQLIVQNNNKRKCGTKARENIYRATHEESVRPEIIANMKEGESIVILDWKMKFLAAKQREAMQEFFGKAGITWEKK